MLTLGLSAPTLPQTACLSSAIPGAAPYLPEPSAVGGGSVFFQVRAERARSCTSSLGNPKSQPPAPATRRARRLRSSGSLALFGMWGQDAVRKRFPCLREGASHICLTGDQPLEFWHQIQPSPKLVGHRPCPLRLAFRAGEAPPAGGPRGQVLAFPTSALILSGRRAKSSWLGGLHTGQPLGLAGGGDPLPLSRSRFRRNHSPGLCLVFLSALETGWARIRLWPPLVRVRPLCAVALTLIF